MYSADSASGLVSSYRKMVSLFSGATPSFSNANYNHCKQDGSHSDIVGQSCANRLNPPLTSKFMFIDLACPTCKYPLGSGGNLVLTLVPFTAACSAISRSEFTAEGKSRAPKRSFPAVASVLSVSAILMQLVSTRLARFRANMNTETGSITADVKWFPDILDRWPLLFSHKL